MNASIESYELEGDFLCTAILRACDFVGFHDELNLFLPPGMPPIPDPDMVLSYVLLAWGVLGERDAVAGPAVAWDFAMSWATDVSLEMTVDCVGAQWDFKI